MKTTLQASFVGMLALMACGSFGAPRARAADMSSGERMDAPLCSQQLAPGCEVGQMQGTTEVLKVYKSQDGRILRKEQRPDEKSGDDRDLLRWATRPSGSSDSTRPRIAIMEISEVTCPHCANSRNAMDLISQACGTRNGNVRVIEAMDSAFGEISKAEWDSEPLSDDDQENSETFASQWAQSPPASVKPGAGRLMMLFPSKPGERMWDRLTAMGLTHLYPSFVVLVNGRLVVFPDEKSHPPKENISVEVTPAGAVKGSTRTPADQAEEEKCVSIKAIQKAQNTLKAQGVALNCALPATVKPCAN